MKSVMVTVTVALWVSTVARGSPQPIGECKTALQVLADNNSCTRFHVCRLLDDGQFTTDIAVCPNRMLFDMVSLTCINLPKGYVQDPSSCTKFFGCHPSAQGGGGLVRRRYSCTGELRFHPVRRHCTYRTDVPDVMCNNSKSAQQIIGQHHAQTTTTTRTTTISTTTTPASTTKSRTTRASTTTTASIPKTSSTSTSTRAPTTTTTTTTTKTSIPVRTTTTASTTTTTPSTTTTAPTTTTASTTPTTTTASTTTTTAPTSTTTTTTAPTSTTVTAPPRVAGGSQVGPPSAFIRKVNHQPITDVTDLQRITQVIKGQLLARNKVNSREAEPAIEQV
ncbi:uncharacterized protein DDB_G0290587-like [Procambarus clarkii]|uniref:uncharacterized protein DDB_G0290587-like n=1 Tax=Procambarus clarkii TaxID=6728 RepID=UPI0037421D3D